MILNLTRHRATTEQIAEGVLDMPIEKAQRLDRLLRFETVPTKRDVLQRASTLAQFAVEAAGDFHEVATNAMIDGPPFLLGPLERALEEVFIGAIYSFTPDTSIETLQENDSIGQTGPERHFGWVEACQVHEQHLPDVLTSTRG